MSDIPIDDYMPGEGYEYTFQPSKYKGLYNILESMSTTMWFTEEIDMKMDKIHWKSLNDSERHFLKHIIAFFAASDGIVNENLAQRFMGENLPNMAKIVYSYQCSQENVHSETYSMLLNVLVDDVKERDRLFDAIHQIPSISKKAEWAMKWIYSERPLRQRLVAFAAVEGIFFSGSFCGIFWFLRSNKMPGLGVSNQWISRDENGHCEVAVTLFHMTDDDDVTTNEIVLEIIKSAVECEVDFNVEGLPVGLVGMNASLMTQYIKYMADRLLVSLGCSPYYQCTNPFPWMEQIGMKGKTNIFENRVTEYSKLAKKRINNSIFKNFV